MEFVFGSFLCFNIEIANSNFTFCVAWTQSICLGRGRVSAWGVFLAECTPPPAVDRMTGACDFITFLQLLLRTVKIETISQIWTLSQVPGGGGTACWRRRVRCSWRGCGQSGTNTTTTTPMKFYSQVKCQGQLQGQHQGQYQSQRQGQRQDQHQGQYQGQCQDQCQGESQGQYQHQGHYPEQTDASENITFLWGTKNCIQ